MSGAVQKNVHQPISSQSRDTSTIQKQYSIFNLDADLIKVYENKVHINSKNDYHEYKLRKNKKEIEPDSFNEFYGNMLFLKESLNINMVDADDAEPRSNSSSDILYKQFKFNYIIPNEYQKLVFDNNKMAANVSYIKNLEFIYRCELETELKCLKYIGIVGSYLVIYGISVMSGTKVFSMILSMNGLDNSKKKNIILGLLYIAKWINSASLVAGSNQINAKIDKIILDLTESKEEDISKILHIGDTAETPETAEPIHKSTGGIIQIGTDICNFVSKYSQFFMYLPLLSNEFKYFTMDASLRNSARFNTMLQNILFNKSPYLQIIRAGRSYSEQIFKIHNLSGSNLEWVTNSILSMVDNPFAQLKFNTFTTNALTSNLFPESIVKDKFAEDGERDPFGKRFDVIQLRQQGYTDKQINDIFVELIEEKVTGKTSGSEFNYNPEELTKLINVGVPLFFSVELFNVIYESPHHVDGYIHTENSPHVSSYEYVKRFINMVFGLIRTFIPEYNIKTYIINNFIITWRNALISTYHKIKKILQKMNQIVKEHVQIYNMFSEWLNKEIIYSFSISSIVTSFVDFFFTQSITNTFSGVSRLLMMKDITSKNFFEEQFILNLNILKKSFNSQNLGRSIELLFRDKSSFYWAMFSGTIPDSIFNNFNTLKDNIFIQEDKDLIGQTLWLKNPNTNTITASYKIVKLGDHISDEYKKRCDNDPLCDKTEPAPFMILKNSAGEFITIQTLNDLLNNPDYFSDYKFNFYLIKDLEVSGFISANYLSNKYTIETDISSVIFRNIELSDDHLHSFFRPDEKMLCYINLTKIILELQFNDKTQKESKNNKDKCLTIFNLDDTFTNSEKIKYLKQITDTDAYKELIKQIDEFKKQHTKYLMELRQLVTSNFKPFAEKIITQSQIEPDTTDVKQKYTQSFIIQSNIEKLISSIINKPYENNRNLLDILLIQNGWSNKENLSLIEILNIIKSEYIVDRTNPKYKEKDEIVKIKNLKKYFQSVIDMDDAKHFLPTELKSSILTFMNSTLSENGDYNVSKINADVIELTSRIESAFNSHKDVLLSTLFGKTNFNILFELFNKKELSDFNDNDRRLLKDTFKIDIHGTTTIEHIKTQLYGLIKCSMVVPPKADCSITKYDEQGNASQQIVDITSVLLFADQSEPTEKKEAEEILFPFFKYINDPPNDFKNINDVFQKMCDDDTKEIFNNFIIMAIKNYDNYDKEMCTKKIEELIGQNVIICLNDKNKTQTLGDIKGISCADSIPISPTHHVNFKEYLDHFFVKQNILYLRNIIKFNDKHNNGLEFSSILSILNNMITFSNYAPNDIFNLCSQMNAAVYKKVVNNNRFKNLHQSILQKIITFFNTINLNKESRLKEIYDTFDNSNNNDISQYLFEIFSKLNLNSDAITPHDDGDYRERIQDAIFNHLHDLLGVDKKELLFLFPSKLENPNGHELYEPIVNTIIDLFNTFKVSSDAKGNIIIKHVSDNNGFLPDNHYAFTVLKSVVKIQNLIYGKTDLPPDIAKLLTDTTNQMTHNILSSIEINQAQRVNDLYLNIRIIFSQQDDLKGGVNQLIHNIQEQIDNLPKPVHDKVKPPPSSQTTTTTTTESRSTIVEKLASGNVAGEEVHQSNPEQQTLGQQSQEQQMIVNQSVEKLGNDIKQAQSHAQSQRQSSKSETKNEEKNTNRFATPDEIRTGDTSDYGIKEDVIDTLIPPKPLSNPRTTDTATTNKQQSPPQPGPILLDCSQVSFNHYKGAWYHKDDKTYTTSLLHQESYREKCYSFTLIGSYLEKGLNYLLQKGYDSINILEGSVKASCLAAIGGNIPVIGIVAMPAVNICKISLQNLFLQILPFTGIINTFLTSYVTSMTNLKETFEKNGVRGNKVNKPELGYPDLKTEQLHDYAWISFLCRFKFVENLSSKYVAYGYIISTIKSLLSKIPLVNLFLDADILKSLDTPIVMHDLTESKSICRSILGGIEPKNIPLYDSGPDISDGGFVVDIYNKKLITSLLKLIETIITGNNPNYNGAFNKIVEKIRKTIRNADNLNKKIDVTDIEITNEDSLAEDVYDPANPSKILANKNDKITEIMKKLFIEKGVLTVNINQHKFMTDIIDLGTEIYSMLDLSKIPSITNIFEYTGIFIGFFTSFYKNIKEWDEIFEESNKNGIRSLFFGRPNLSPVASAYDLYVQQKKKSGTKVDNEPVKLAYKKAHKIQLKVIDEKNDIKSFNLFQQYLLKMHTATKGDISAMSVIDNLNGIKASIPYITDVKFPNMTCDTLLKRTLYNKLLNGEIMVIESYDDKIADNIKKTQQISEKSDKIKEAEAQAISNPFILTDYEKQVITCYNNINSDMEQMITLLGNKSSAISGDYLYLIENNDKSTEQDIYSIIETFNITTLIKNVNNFDKFNEIVLTELEKNCPSIKIDMETTMTELRKLLPQEKITLKDYIDNIIPSPSSNPDCNYFATTLNIFSRMFVTEYGKDKPELTYDNYNNNDSVHFINSLHILFHKHTKELSYYNKLVKKNQTDSFKLEFINGITIQIPHLALDPKDPNSGLVVLHILHNIDHITNKEELKGQLLTKTQLIYNYYNAVNDALKELSSVNWNCVNKRFNTKSEKVPCFKEIGNKLRGRFNSLQPYYSQIEDIKINKKIYTTCSDSDYNKQLPEYLLMITNIKYNCLKDDLIANPDNPSFYESFDSPIDGDGLTIDERNKIFKRLEIDNTINLLFFNYNLLNADTKNFITDANEYLKPFLNTEYLDREGGTAGGIKDDIFNGIFNNNTQILNKKHLITPMSPYYNFIKSLLFLPTETERENTFIFGEGNLRIYREVNLKLVNIIRQNSSFFNYYYYTWTKWFVDFATSFFGNTVFLEEFQKYLLKELTEYIKVYKPCEKGDNDKFQRNFLNNIISNPPKELEKNYHTAAKILLSNIKDVNSRGTEEYATDNVKYLFEMLGINCELINNPDFQKDIHSGDSSTWSKESLAGKYKDGMLHLFEKLKDRSVKKHTTFNIVHDAQSSEIKNIGKDNVETIKFYYMFGFILNCISKKSKTSKTIKDKEVITNFITDKHISANLQGILKKSLNEKIKTELFNVINSCHTKDVTFKRIINEILNKIITEGKLMEGSVKMQKLTSETKLTPAHVKILYSNKNLIHIVNSKCPDSKIEFNRKIHHEKYTFEQRYEFIITELMTSFFFNNLDVLKGEFIEYLNTQHSAAEIARCVSYQYIENKEAQTALKNFENKENFKEILDTLLNVKDNTFNSNILIEHIHLFLCLSTNDANKSYKDLIIEQFFNNLQYNSPKYNKLKEQKSFPDFLSEANFIDIIMPLFHEHLKDAKNLDNQIESIIHYLDKPDIDILNQFEEKVKVLKNTPEHITPEKHEKLIEEDCIPNKLKIFNELKTNADFSIQLLSLRKDPLESLKDKSGKNEAFYKAVTVELDNVYKNLTDNYSKIKLFDSYIQAYTNILDCLPSFIINIDNQDDINIEDIDDTNILELIKAFNMESDEKQKQIYFLTIKKYIASKKPNETKRNEELEKIKKTMESIKQSLISILSGSPPMIQLKPLESSPEVKGPRFGVDFSNIYQHEGVHFRTIYGGNNHPSGQSKFVDMIKSLIVFCKDHATKTTESKQKNDPRSFYKRDLEVKIINRGTYQLERIFNLLNGNFKKYLSWLHIDKDIMTLIDTPLSDKDIDASAFKLPDSFNNLFHKGLGPYKFVNPIYANIFKMDKKSCSAIKTDNYMVTIKGSDNIEHKVNFFELIDENLGTPIHQSLMKQFVLDDSKFVNHDDMNIKEKKIYNKFTFDENCNIKFTEPGFFGETIIDLGNLEKIVKETVVDSIKLFNDMIRIIKTQPELTQPELIDELKELLEVSKDIEEEKEEIINPLSPEAYAWLYNSTRRKQSGGGMEVKVKSHNYDIEYSRLFPKTLSKGTIELYKWYMTSENIIKINDEIDKSTDTEFLDILNEIQLFKNRIKVNLMLYTLDDFKEPSSQFNVS